MIGLSFKSAALSLAIVCFLGGSAVADSFTFTGTATLGNDVMDFFLSGPSFSIHSASPSGPAGSFGICSQGTLCTIPGQFIQTFGSYLSAPGDFSGGTVGGITADTLLGRGLIFSGFSFTTGTGSGPVTFTGDLIGYAFLPLGCDKTFTCTDIGPQVFHLHLSGSGIGTASGEDIGQGQDGIRQLDYTFHGTATIVPEPSSVLLLSSGLTGLAAMWWHFRSAGTSGQRLSTRELRWSEKLSRPAKVQAPCQKAGRPRLNYSKCLFPVQSHSYVPPRPTATLSSCEHTPSHEV